MSGVFGIADSSQQARASVRPDVGQLLRGMAARLTHRDWHVVETYADTRQGLGLGRVGTGIFNRERQPVCSEDQNVVVFLSGEFYHTAGLRRDLQARGHTFRDEATEYRRAAEVARSETGHSRSDAELLLRLYQEKGERFIHDLEGVFVLAIWDRNRQELIVANDRFGLCPLLYAHYNGVLAFAPEVEGILADPAFEKRLDLTGLAQFFRFQRLLGDRTFFEGLHVLPYASMLRFDQANDRVEVSHYWDFDQIPAWPASATFDDAVVEAGRLLRRAVDVRTQGGYRIGVYLSGGLDSRTLLGFASQICPPVVSLTYGVPGCRDAYYAERIARRLNSPHHFFPLVDGRWMREAADFHLQVTGGFAVWTHGHAAPTFMPGRDLMDVNLTGFGGDQVLGGRGLTYAPLLLTASDDVAFTCQAFSYLNQVFSWPGITEVEERSLYTPETYAQVAGRAWDSLKEELQRFSGFPHARRWDFFTTIHQGTRLSNLNVVYQRSFFEARYPFCDYALVDFVYSMPVEYRLNDRLYLDVINREIPAVTWVPRNTDGRLLVNRRWIRQAHGLWQAVCQRITREHRRIIHEDPEGWLRRDLREWAEELLFDPRTLARGIFNPAFLRSIFERHMSGHEVHTIGKIAPIMTYEMMLRCFYD